MFGIGAMSWGRLVTTLYPKEWAETHRADQYDISAGDGLTYRYYRVKKLATFGEGMPSEKVGDVQLACELQKNHGPNRWETICDAKNFSTRSFSAVLMIFARASDEVHKAITYPVPLRALKKFERFMVYSGEMKTYRIKIDIKDLMRFNSEGHKEALPGRHFDIIDV